MKKILVLLSILITVVCSYGQKIPVITKVPIDPNKSALKIANPIVTSPVAGSVINGPFVIVGKSKPNAKITLHVFPIYKKGEGSSVAPLILGQSSLYKQQNFTVVADASGKWQSPMVEVKFYDKATDKKIHIFSAQESEGQSSPGKMTAYKVPGPIMVITTIPGLNIFSIKTPSNNSIVTEDARVTGTAKAGVVVKVMIHSGYSPVNGGGPVAGAKQELYATAGNDGKWSTDVANFNIITNDYLKSTYLIVATVENSSEKKEIKVIHPRATSVETSSFSLTTPVGVSVINNSPFKVKGKARPGSTIEVIITYNGTETYEYDPPGPFGGTKKITNKKDAVLSNNKITADVNGEWQVSTGMRKVWSGATSDDKHTMQASSMVIKASIIDGTGKRLKTETATLMFSVK